MKREDIKKQFPDATDEQISALLDINGTDIEDAKKNNVDPKTLKQLQDDAAAYKKLQEANLTDAEKIQKALAEAEASKVDFAKKSNRLDVEKILVAAGLAEADYADLIDTLVSDDAEKSKTSATAFANLVSKQKEAAIQKTKEEMMDGTQTPGGDGGDDDKEKEKTEAEKFAESFGQAASEAAKASSDIIGSYLD